MNELGHRYIDVVKMDIEGSEYDVINDISRSKIRPKQLLIEFHHRFPEVGIRRTKVAISTLRSMGYKIFSVSSHGIGILLYTQPCRLSNRDRTLIFFLKRSNWQGRHAYTTFYNYSA